MSTHIELHTELADHPKVDRLAEALGVGYATAFACLTILWLRAADIWPSGELRNATDGDIAKAARWKEWGPHKSATDFVKALTTTGWLDADRHIHDWEDAGIRLKVQFHQRMAKARTVLAEQRSQRPTPKAPARPRPQTPQCPACRQTFTTQVGYLKHECSPIPPEAP